MSLKPDELKWLNNHVLEIKQILLKMQNHLLPDFFSKKPCTYPKCTKELQEKKNNLKKSIDKLKIAIQDYNENQKDNFQVFELPNNIPKTDINKLESFFNHRSLQLKTLLHTCLLYTSPSPRD